MAKPAAITDTLWDEATKQMRPPTKAELHKAQITELTRMQKEAMQSSVAISKAYHRAAKSADQLAKLLKRAINVLPRKVEPAKKRKLVARIREAISEWESQG